MKSAGYLVKEEKDFIPTGQTKPKAKRRITIPVAFWPLESREKMDEVLERMRTERPTSEFEIEVVPKHHLCKYECSDCDNVFEAECQGKWGAVCPKCFQDHTVLVG